MIILDTNVLSELMKPKKSEAVRNWTNQQPLMSLFTTTITQAEILYGITLSSYFSLSTYETPNFYNLEKKASSGNEIKKPS